MPSKVPAEEPEIDMDESEFDMDDSAMMGAPVPERKEYLWATNLEGPAPYKFEGGDNEDEQVIFKSCALGPGAKGKHVIELSAVDANSEKATVILGILTDANPYLRLPDISVEPPLLLKLSEGKGPVNIGANHLVNEEMDDEDDESDMDEEEMEAELRTAEDVESEEEEEEPVKPEPVKAASPKKAAAKTVEPKAATKRKASEVEEEADNKKAKKAPKEYSTVEELKKAIQANPGGKPKKEEKFKNWLRNTMKCQKEEWFSDVFKWWQAQAK
ncbi:Oidioi.mRNA.OKI2018_I69.chr2.g6888.t1.cds [Oikopleura dioica]|uniref:Oidioi.mRNA.OKI2018_I69.chr2.g6888.t1.cds n=1 Tax=Oikopleura dioica TaxID=34765 RepID=A0ABN7TDN3_OIKDI|nr:Oidioi.mRNA.OKI2018_I69.chr2.g6888.t1.cds [Oikopleura dioica]